MRFFRAISIFVIVSAFLPTSKIANVNAAVLTHAQVTIRGTFYYDDRLDHQVVAPFMTVNLYDHSPTWGDTQIGSLTTDSNGYFSFSTENWNYFEGRHLNVYAEWMAEYHDSASTIRRVANMSWDTYKYYSYTATDVQDNTIVDLSSVWHTGFGNLKALWIFQDLRRSWHFIYNNSNPQIDPGSVTARWETGVTGIPICGGNGSCFNIVSNHEPFIFIADQSAVSSDNVIHEARSLLYL